MAHYPVREVYVANTDWAWFEFLSGRSSSGRVDEVNFWSPRATRPMKKFHPGEPMFFKLKAPRYVIAGYGFFAAYHFLDLDTCWELFGWKNGVPDRIRFLQRTGEYRDLDLFDPRAERHPIGCNVFRDATFWPMNDGSPGETIAVGPRTSSRGARRRMRPTSRR